MVFLNSYLLKTEKIGYLLIDSDIPIHRLPFEEGSITQLGGFEETVEKVLSRIGMKPEKKYEIGEGLLEHMSHSIYLTPEQAAKVIGSEKAYAQKEKGTHAIALRHFEELAKQLDGMTIEI